MSQYSFTKFHEYDSSGPRPPIPGEESRKPRMIDSHHHLDFMTSSTSITNRSPPSCLKWARTLTSLLEDRDGVELFKKYVESEGGIHSDRLNFYFACEGLKQQSDPDKVKQIIGAIYRFLRKSQLHVPEDIKRTVKAGLKDEIILTPDLYDQMQQDVEKIINETTYPNFLQSELYLQHVREVQEKNAALQATMSPPQVPLVPPPPIAATTQTTTATSSSITSENSSKFLSRSSTLPTLHEESECAANIEVQDFGSALPPPPPPHSESVRSNSGKLPMSLTKDALRVTQQRRLEMRPPGTHGYSVYNAYSSYNPVSRRDSELASLSSGRTDSDTMSLSSISTDGRPQRRHHHHHSSLERKLIRENVAANQEASSLAIIPRTQRVDVKSQQLSQEDFLAILIPKLEAVRVEQERMELLNRKLLEIEASDKAKSSKIFADAIREKFQMDDDNDQDILDQHVSRVWSDMTPNRSPGTLSPCNPLSRRKHEIGAFSAGTSTQSSMRYSKSMPENANLRKLSSSKWGSINTDSGISLFSSDTIIKHNKDSLSISSSSSSSIVKQQRSPMLPPEHIKIEELRRKQEEEARRSKRYVQPPLPPPQKNIIPPPLPAKPQAPQPQQLQQQQQQQPTHPQEFTTVVYSFCDEEVPYRIKIPTSGRNPPTLKQFKDYLPKKGNYRFFFKTRCDDDDNPIIQEEMSSDSDYLPLFEGKVMGTVKPAN